jgi:E1 ligase-like protein/ThiF family protein
VINLTREQENRKLLAALLDIPEDEAAERLDVFVLVTSASDASSLRVARNVQEMLKRTVRAAFEVREGDLPAAEVVVGAASRRTNSPAIFVAHVEEGIRVARSPSAVVNRQRHSIFDLIASCYATGMALRSALTEALPYGGHDAILISPEALLGGDLELLEFPLVLQDAVLVGAGAVGNGFLWGLRHFNVKGELHIVDPKRVHDGILNRCVWFDDRDIGEAKAQAIVRRAQDAFADLTLMPHAATLQEFYTKQGAPRLGRVITTVDSRRARRGIQGELPREVYDASTTGIAEVVLHFNKQPSELACLACVYKEDAGEMEHEAHVAEALGVSVDDVRKGFIDRVVAERMCCGIPDCNADALIGKAFDTVFKERCAEGNLRTAEDKQVLAPFCFVSVLAGAFLALEFVRRASNDRVAEPFNYWRLSPWHGPNIVLRSIRHALPNCVVCSDSVFPEVMKQVWSIT